MIMTSPDAAPVISERFNVAFSENGCWGVCLRTNDEDVVLERWTLTAQEARCQAIPNVAVDRDTSALPLDDGRILLFHRGGHGGGRDASGRGQLACVQPRGNDFDLHQLGAVPALPGGYLLPSPNSAQLGFVVTLDGSTHSTIWRLSASPPQIDPIVRVPGSLSGGVWLDADAGVFAANQTCDSHRSSGIAVDLLHGSWRRIWSVSDTSTDRIVRFSPRSKLLVVTTNACGEERLGLGLLGEQTVRFPETLQRPGYVRKALALDDRGERLVLHEAAGAVSRLLVYTPASDRLEPLAGPLGTFFPPVSWVGDLIRLRFSAPSQPPTLATVRLEPEPRWSVGRDHGLERQPVRAQAELIELEGPTGPIEAIVYGGPDWRWHPHLVVALHGGPLSSWRFEFNPLFQHLAAAGVAVVAPNYRGSTGYGDAHLRAVIGNWGGPDLDDVLHLGRSLEQARERRGLTKPIVMGTSYGAYLALLAACRSPTLWSACIALAPFLSCARLHKSVRATIRYQIEALGGLKQIDDANGPRDVLRACGSLATPLLLVHGINDTTVPVEQSRILRRRLVELGRTEGIDFLYLETDSDHKDVVLAREKVLRHRIVRFCLARPGPARQEQRFPLLSA
jgi:pimeloyl-ACP methyl ester carboxylesterase